MFVGVAVFPVCMVFCSTVGSTYPSVKADVHPNYFTFRNLTLSGVGLVLLPVRLVGIKGATVVLIPAFVAIVI